MDNQKDREAVHRLAKDSMTVAIALMFATLALGGALIATERQLERQALVNQERVQW